MSIPAPITGQTVPPAAYRLERRAPVESHEGATCLGQGDDLLALLALAEEHAAALLAAGEACVLCVVEAATGQPVARRPVWPPGGPRPGEDEDAWWRPDAEASLAH